jgi:hypothetical protein
MTCKKYDCDDFGQHLRGLRRNPVPGGQGHDLPAYADVREIYADEYWFGPDIRVWATERYVNTQNPLDIFGIDADSTVQEWFVEWHRMESQITVFDFVRCPTPDFIRGYITAWQNCEWADGRAAND